MKWQEKLGQSQLVKSLRRWNHDSRFILINVVLAFVLLNLVASQAYVRLDLTPPSGPGPRDARG